jgi:subtilisin family serine protease
MRRSLIAATTLLAIISWAVQVPVRAFAQGASNGSRIAVLFDEEQSAIDLAAFEQHYDLTAIRPVLDSELVAFDASATATDVLARVRKDTAVSAASEVSYGRLEQAAPPSSLPPAATAITVSLPATMTAQAGSQFVLPLTVSEGKGIGSFAISVIYDPSKVTYVKTEASTATQGFKFVDGELDADGGLKERIIGGSSATKIDKSGQAVLAQITFAANSTASGDLTFKLHNPLDDISTATLQNGTVTIGTSAAVAPSDPLFEAQWWLNNTGQSFFIGLARLIIRATGIDQMINFFPATAGHDIRWSSARALGACGGNSCTGGGVTVAVIDTGVDVSHPDLAGQISTASTSFDPETQSVGDTDGHGTFIAGLIAAKMNNGIGIAGVAPDARILALKYDFSSIELARAIRYAAEQGASVINISSGFGALDPIVGEAISYASSAPFNTVIVASAGNHAEDDCSDPTNKALCYFGYSNPVLFPASSPHVISVGAVNPNGTHTFFSEENSLVDVSAPGGFIVSLKAIGTETDCKRNGTPYDDVSFSISYDGRDDCVFTDGQQNGAYYTSESGTSFSAPIVAAAAALAKQKWPLITSDQFEQLVRETADLAPDQTGADTHYGAGTLNLERLLSFNFPPELPSGSVALTQPVVSNSGSDTTQLIARVTDMDGASDIRSVSVDAAGLALSGLAMTGASDGSFTSSAIAIPASIQPGDYSLTVTARDAAGGQATAIAHLQVIPVGGVVPPAAIAGAAPDVSVSILKPSSHRSTRVTSKKTLAISGTVGTSAAYVEVNGDPADLDASTKTWGAKVKLKEGKNKIDVTSYDVTRMLSDEQTISVTLNTQTTATGSVSGFTDVPNDHFAARAIAQLKELRIVSGEGGRFRPDGLVTRAEYAKMLAGATRTPEARQSMFGDVSASHPLAGFVAAIAGKGWASGQGGHFRPNAAITRIEAAAMIARAKNLRGGKVGFSDVADPAMQQYASAVAEAGVATGQDGRFEPQRALTRGEAAKMIAAIL